MTIEVSDKDILFSQFEQRWICKHNDHDWHVVLFLEEPILHPSIALCKKCSFMTSGRGIIKND